MTISELIDAAVEAEQQFGELTVAFIGQNNLVSFMDVCVAEVNGKPMFTFLVIEPENKTMQ